MHHARKVQCCNAQVRRQATRAKPVCLGPGSILPVNSTSGMIAPTVCFRPERTCACCQAFSVPKPGMLQRFLPEISWCLRISAAWVKPIHAYTISSMSLAWWSYIYIYISLHTYIYIYIYTPIHREGEAGTPRGSSMSWSEELRDAAGAQWSRITQHRFTRELAAGTLDLQVSKGKDLGMGQNLTTRGPQVLVLGSIYHISLGYRFLTHTHMITLGLHRCNAQGREKNRSQVSKTGTDATL